MRSALPTAPLRGVRVFLRADLNVPIIGGRIIDDFRLRALMPTLDLLCNAGAKIILATHRGRPADQKASQSAGTESRKNELSTEYLMSWFAEHEYAVRFAPTLDQAQTMAHQLKEGTILLLENVRFFRQERKGTSEEQLAYAKQLRSLADYYVNDAWALMHKHDVSIALLPTLFTDKTVGLLVERELTELQKLRNPQRPYVMFLGGAKLDKLSFVEQALQMADTVVLLPALAFTFLQAKGVPVGSSLVAPELPYARTLIERAREASVNLVLPEDFLVGNSDLGALEITNQIPPDKIGISVGPRSLEQYRELVDSAETIFYNGAMGFFERPETLEPLIKLLQSIARTNAYSVVGGGESVAAVNLFNLAEDISFCSTGGGATTYFLVHGTAPGLQPL